MTTLIIDTTAALVGDPFSARGLHTTFQSSGTGVATIQVSNDRTNWVDLGTLTNTDGIASQASWAFYRANVSSATGSYKVYMN